LERYTERIFHNFWKAKIDPWFTPQRRKQALFIFGLIAFLYANFRAFDEQSRSAQVASLSTAHAEMDRDAAVALAGRRQDEIARATSQIAALQPELSNAVPPKKPFNVTVGQGMLAPRLSNVLATAALGRLAAGIRTPDKLILSPIDWMVYVTLANNQDIATRIEGYSGLKPPWRPILIGTLSAEFHWETGPSSS
jgi:hypothetical protein